MKLINGDCLEEMKNIPDGSVDMILTDPPYGTTQNKWDSVIDLNLMWTELNRIVKDDGAVVMTAQQPFTSHLIMSNPKNFKYCWTWVKEAGTGFLNAKKYPLKDNEDVVVFCRKPHIYNPQMREGEPYTITQGKTKSKNYGTQTGATTVSDGKRYPLTTIHFARDKGKVHPTQKPVALLEYLIKTYTQEGELILDNTAGSGSLAIAAINTNRKYICIEKDPHYFEVMENRIANHVPNAPAKKAKVKPVPHGQLSLFD